MQLISSNILSVPVIQSAGIHHGGENEFRFGLRVCPTMDLVVTFPQLVPSDKAIDRVIANESAADEYYEDDDEEALVHVHRLNGQKAFTIGIETNRGSIGIVDVAWRSDGVLLAIITSDSNVRLVNSFSGKIVHIFSSISENTHNDPGSSTAAKLGRSDSTQILAAKKRRCMPMSITYSVHFAESSQMRKQFHEARTRSTTSLDSLLEFNADVQGLLKLKSDLPRDFATIDLEQHLPRLSTLPANGLGEEDVFATKTSMDTLFHAGKQTNTLSTDIISAIQTDGMVHLRVFDSFEVGDIDLNEGVLESKYGHVSSILRVITHPFLNKPYVIARCSPLRGQGQVQETFHLLSLNLRFLQQAPGTLPMLATKATQLRNLIRYLSQIESQLAREVKTAFDLPARFLRTLDQDLEEQDGEGSTFETAAYHAILTGVVHGKYKEWLHDIVGERNSKRWEKTVLDCLEIVRRLIEENWSPAVERAGVVLSTLSGLAWANPDFGADKAMLESLGDTVSVMAILAERLIQEVTTETNKFNAFMKWLKREVEMAALEETSEKLDEMREASDHNDLRKVFEYIHVYLRNTSVKKYIQIAQTEKGWEADNGGFYAAYKEAAASGGEQPYLSMKSLTVRVSTLCETLFRQIATKLKTSVMVEHVCEIASDLDQVSLDARIVSESNVDHLHIVSRAASKPDTVIKQDILLKDSAQAITTYTVQEQMKGIDTIVDLKIADDENFMGLVQTAGQYQIIQLPLSMTAKAEVVHTFTRNAESLFVKFGDRPDQLQINGRSKRRTVVVGDVRGHGYIVLDLDSAGRDERQ